MKAFKHIIAALLCIVFALSLCACEPEGDETLILGSWEAEFDVSDTLKQLIPQTDTSYDQYFDLEGISFTIRYTFLEDGKFEYGFSEDASREDYDRFVNEFKKGMRIILDDAYSSQYGGFAEFCESMGTTEDVILDSYLSDFAPDKIFAVSEGRYKIEEGKILISNDPKANPTGSTYWVYTELTDSSLTVSESYVANSQTATDVFPKVFTKVA